MSELRYNLSPKRPQVLLFGNGLAYTKKWDDVINDLKADEKDISFNNTSVPYPLQSSILFPQNDRERWNNYNQYFNTSKNKKCYPYKNSYPFIEKIAKMDFDAYLTTNYTYELENELHPGYLNLSGKTRYAKSTVGAKDSRRNKFTYNSFNCNNKEKRIWHIHGEARKKSSLIFTHNDYCRLIGDLTNINKTAGNKYEIYYNDFKIESWMDYFIVSDMYILGFSLDFSENDIWWLLSRRLREKAGYGKIYFFEPNFEGNANKYKVLKRLDINHIDCGISGDSAKSGDDNYNEFYESALNKIDSLIKETTR